MENLGDSAVWGLAIGASLVAGAAAAALTDLPERVAAVMTAFGGGILLAAIALELVPEADAGAGAGLTAAGLVAGTVVYVGADAWLTRDEHAKAMRRAGHAMAAGASMADAMPGAAAAPAASARRDHAEAARGEAIAAGIFIDGVPESIALGLTIAEGEIGVALLAGILIGNLVEAYGAAQPIVHGGHTKGFAVRLLGGIGLALAAATVLGGTVLADASPELIGTAQAVAAGAVLAVVSIAIVPHAFKEVSRLTAVATVAGFVAGYLLS
jgi:ZIP family zinc transporter